MMPHHWRPLAHEQISIFKWRFFVWTFYVLGFGVFRKLLICYLYVYACPYFKVKLDWLNVDIYYAASGAKVAHKISNKGSGYYLNSSPH